MSDAYDMIDRFLRNNLGDDDYAEYSGALDSLCSAQPAQADNLLVKRAEWDALSTDARQLLNAAARAQTAPITSENGNQADQGASAITSVEVPRLTRPEQDALYRETSKRVAQLEAENRYEFASWFFIAVELIEAALIAKWSKT